jgi:hypothetical protein
MYLVWAWARWSTFDEVKKWTKRQMKNEATVLRLAEVLPSTSYQSGGDGQQKVRSLDMESIGKIIDVEALKKKLEKIAGKKNATEATKKLYADFVEAEKNGKENRN